MIGDQIRINRPGHKYRLTVEVETPEGRKSASGVHGRPSRSQLQPPRPDPHLGDAVFVDLGQGKNLVALLAHVDNNLDLDDMNYVALRAYTAAAGKRVSFNEMSRLTGTVPVKGALIPVLSAFADPANPGTARGVARRCRGGARQGLSVCRGSPPKWCRTDTGRLDFGGVLGEPVTRGIQAKLPWLSGAGNSAAAALRAAGLPGVEAIDAREAFTRK